VKLLHTADWHVGKGLRGVDRAEEHRAVLGEIAAIAAREHVDVVLVCGDLFDTAAPTASSERIVYEALLSLADSGAHVVVLAGNHDNPRRLAAVAPVFAHARVHVADDLRRPADGGVLTLESRTGERVRVALLPFVSQRAIVRADELMARSAADHSLEYAERLRRVVHALCDTADDTPVVLAAHAFVADAVLGGGERSAHTIFTYALPATAFPPHVAYVALGHLHRAQQLPGATAVHYCGSPLALDFSERDDPKQVNLVEVQPGRPAKVAPVRLAAGRPLRTLRGSFDDVVAAAAGLEPDALVRVVLDGPARAGLADEVREHVPGVVHIELLRSAGAAGAGSRGPARGRNRPPHELFADFLASRGVADRRLESLFAELLEASSAAPAD
jgi:exonuclease SbcD